MTNPFTYENFDSKGYLSSRPKYPERFFDILAENLCKRNDPSKNESASRTGDTPQLAVDVGCGPGFATVSLAERFEKVIAIDPSKLQLLSAPEHSHIEYRNCDALTLGREIAPNSVNLLFFGQSFHWVGPENAISVAKKLLSVSSPSLMTICAYHSSYVSKREALPQHVERELYGDETKDDSLPCSDTRNRNGHVKDEMAGKVYFEDVTHLYPPGKEKTLHTLRLYECEEEATQVIRVLPKTGHFSPCVLLKEAEYNTVEFPFKYRKTHYMHSIQRMNVLQMLQEARTWSQIVGMSEKDREEALETFRREIKELIGLENDEGEFIVCRFYYLMLFSDNQELL